MKNIIYLAIVVSAMMWYSCTPYEKIAGLKSFEDIQYPYHSKKITLPDGVSISYVEEGTGPETIIFIHGLGSYLPAWKKNIEGLKSQFRCIAIDLPGYGKSSKDPHSGLMSYYADEVMKFAEAMGLKEFTLAGHSMGGQISIVAGIMNPDKVKKLILVDPAGFERFTEGQKQWFRDIMTFEGVKLTTPEQIQNNLASNFYNVPTDAEFMITDRIAMRSASDFDAYCYAVVQSVKGMVNEPVIDHLEQITQPVLLFFGENDNLIPNRFLNPGFTAKIANFGASKIKNNKLILVPKCGHFMMFEHPDVFNENVITFMK